MIDWITQLIEDIGYLGVAFLSMLEVVIPIIPSEVVLPFSGFAASQGSLNIVGVIIAATMGSVLGSVVLYYIALWFGWERIDRITEKYGKYLGVKQTDIDKAGDFFETYEYKFVFFGRFIPGVRSVIAIPAGLKRMPIVGFAAVTAAGALIWNIGLILAGYLLGDQYHKIENYIGMVSKIIVALVLLGGLYWLYKVRKKNSAR